MTDTNHVDWRDAMDGDIRSLSERVASVEVGITTLGKSFDRFTHAFETADERHMQASKTPWAILLGAATLMVTIFTLIIGGIMSGYIRDLTRVEGDVLAIQSKRVSENDAPQDMRIDALAERMEEIKEDDHEVQRRISKHLSDGHPRRVEEQIVDIRRTLDHLNVEQDKMLQSDPRQDQQLKDLNEEMLNTKRDEHSNMTRDASAIERIRSLERAVFDRAGGGLHDAETHHGEER